MKIKENHYYLIKYLAEEDNYFILQVLEEEKNNRWNCKYSPSIKYVKSKQNFKFTPQTFNMNAFWKYNKMIKDLGENYTFENLKNDFPWYFI